MVDTAKEILPINIEEELKQSYLDYAMSVIVGRALPDVRDGLKPVHRRVLFAMQELGADWNKPYYKSARVVGDVIGKYHPHGDSPVYEAIVRLAQPWAMRYTLVNGQGNFGSIDGDAPAAMRYTEVRMRKMAHSLLADLDKETVDFSPNYDGKEMIPDVLPTRVPNLLVNGSSGIAVGMATNIPPHNLGEVIDGCLAMIDNPAIDIDQLMEIIPGPDFPTAAFINGRKGIVEAYRTGRGRIYIRSRTSVETNPKTGRETIVVSEIPYQVNKARLIEKIAELVKDKKLEGISELRDESDKDGLRIAIEVKRDAVAEVVINNLYTQTQMESVFGINMVALVDGQPKVLNLRDMVDAFIRHRREVVTRRTVYELKKARERGHILEGQAVALANIDEIIEVIKTSRDGGEAKTRLIERSWKLGHVSAMLERAGSTDACRPEDLAEEFGIRDGQYYLSPVQAQAILDLRLQKLTSLESDKIIDEYQQIIDSIAEYLHILGSYERLMEVIREELVAIRDEYSDARRSEIIASRQDYSMEDLITEEDMVVTISHGGYAKSQPLADYQAQRRGGRGKAATQVKDEDYVAHLFVASTHTTIMCFSDRGKVYWLKVWEIPQAGRTAKGRPLINILNLDNNERVTAVLPIEGYEANKFVFMVTAKGTVKKTALEAFSRQRSSGLIALSLDEGDQLVGVAITDGSHEILLLASNGKAVRFSEERVREMGRTARGVRGIRLGEEAEVISLMIPDDEGTILTVSEKGYGKRTKTQDFPTKGRGTQGVIAMIVNDRNGPLVGAVQIFEGDEIMLISDKGTLVRTRSSEISVLGRNTQGVRLIKVAEDESLVGVERVEEDKDVDVGDIELVDGEQVSAEPPLSEGEEDSPSD
ncbi:DNA gyrase subunit A [Gynuella sunshinyii]|uniref:DNA gyrase subunit A n=1 Tax=Gynuella sunshinyii YC6258 TaxID=1445510 RepID=A0A0C5VQA8_9GAMM|nr:DNA gyrase subunit A [Gynuella sunshinyii]AJQ96451.1 type IIA topoisomerase (DNA gyrase/topo II, topoisomerase IV), A subunit [Gynuella sunshinyii YC6258]